MTIGRPGLVHRLPLLLAVWVFLNPVDTSGQDRRGTGVLSAPAGVQDPPGSLDLIRTLPTDRTVLGSIPEGVTVLEPTITPFKPRFGHHAIGFDAHGNIWLAPTVADGEPTVFYLFHPGGSFVSSIAVDDHLNGFKVLGSQFLAIGETEIGEPVLRVYEIR